MLLSLLLLLNKSLLLLHHQELLVLQTLPDLRVLHAEAEGGASLLRGRVILAADNGGMPVSFQIKLCGRDGALVCSVVGLLLGNRFGVLKATQLDGRGAAFYLDAVGLV